MVSCPNCGANSVWKYDCSVCFYRFPHEYQARRPVESIPTGELIGLWVGYKLGAKYHRLRKRYWDWRLVRAEKTVMKARKK